MDMLRKMTKERHRQPDCKSAQHNPCANHADINADGENQSGEGLAHRLGNDDHPHQRNQDEQRGGKQVAERFAL
jgi:hypothetical protein